MNDNYIYKLDLMATIGRPIWMQRKLRVSGNGYGDAIDLEKRTKERQPLGQQLASDRHEKLCPIHPKTG
jgi:hypothetical protein